jgi:sugar phosphate isomerase/epimerase
MTLLGTPYRLGATSYVWPAELLPNIRKLGPLVDDVELVLFEVEGYSNLPDAAALAEMNALAETHQLTYTIHLPLDLTLAKPESLESAKKVIACTRDLEPWAYVLHLDGRHPVAGPALSKVEGAGESLEGNPSHATVTRWQQDARRVLEELALLAGDAQRLCMENLENYAPEHFLPLLEQVPVSLCADAGHLWLTGRDPLSFLDRYLPWTRVIHLHGVKVTGPQSSDHESLLHLGPERVAQVLDLLSARDYGGVLTLEVFGREDFFSSRSLLAEVVNGNR